MLLLIVAAPVLLAIITLIKPHRVINDSALLVGAGIIALFSIGIWCGIFSPAGPRWLDNYFRLDAIGLLFLLIMAVVFLSAAIYSVYYHREQKTSPRRHSFYAASMLLFVAAMIGVILSNHLALLWVFIEATTLTSAVLINFEQKKSALEAAWKYIFICSVGIALAFVGIIILSMGAKSIGSLFFHDLYAGASQINPFWLKMSFAFILVGFGTKIGVAPIHAWLPDAHSEAPSPVSALLSGTLLNTAFLGLIRVQEILIQANLSSFSNSLIRFIGFLSLFISAVFMTNSKNYKRMLAYSSIENMGILFIGLTMGKTGLFAAMLHTGAHSFAKSALFLTSGNILHLTRSKEIAQVRGLLRREPLTGWLWIVAILVIAGLPPFPTFLSKFLLIKAFFESGMGWLVVPFFLFVLIVIFGMMRAAVSMVFADPDSHSHPTSPRLSFLAYLPQILLLVFLLSFGAAIPDKLVQLLSEAAKFLQ
ncbi:MAG TPA: proton-conducting transporter membrane subunit [bacterium]|nr:proton-conducting transporter membrane subunit [bacterium]HPG45701.1 proton-conducting transporter membrane subunit [bacterium]HPM97520.1 proton-conducting transporter membrane subunit [bacterium]